MAVDNNVIANATTAGIRSIHDFQFKPSVMEGIYKTYGQGFSMVDFLRKAAGRSIMVSNESLTAEEQAYTHRTIKIGTVTAISADETSFTLDADDLDTLGNYYPRVGFNVVFGDTITGFTEARITTISSASPPLLTFKRYNTSAPTMTAQISAGNIATGVEVVIGSSAYAVETGQPAATSVGSFEREFFAQIMKETIKFGGMELAKQKWVQVEGVGLYNLELTRAEFLLDLQEAMLCGWDSITTTPSHRLLRLTVRATQFTKSRACGTGLTNSVEKLVSVQPEWTLTTLTPQQLTLKALVLPMTS